MQDAASPSVAVMKKLQVQSFYIFEDQFSGYFSIWHNFSFYPSVRSMIWIMILVSWCCFHILMSIVQASDDFLLKNKTLFCACSSDFSIRNCWSSGEEDEQLKNTYAEIGWQPNFTSFAQFLPQATRQPWLCFLVPWLCWNFQSRQGYASALITIFSASQKEERKKQWLACILCIEQFVHYKGLSI